MTTTAAAPTRRSLRAARRGSPAASGPRVRGPLAVVIPATAGLATALLHGLWSWRQWQRFEVPSWDQGIFTQLLRAYSELRSPVVPIKGPDFMLLGDHFHPLLALLAPVYRVWPSGFTLLAMQAVLLGISAAVVAACAGRHLGKVAGITLGLAYGLAWGLQSATASQFHEIALALPFLAASLAALVRRRHLAAALWSLPLLGIKEDLGLTVAMIGVVIAIRGARRLGLGLAVAGVAVFVLLTQVVLPALNPDGVWQYASDSIVSQVLADPAGAVQGMVVGVGAKVALILLTFGITGFLALRSPLALITLPTFAWRLTSDVEFHWSTDWHYSAVLMPIVLLATVDTLVRHARVRRLAPWAGAFSLVVALVITTQFPLWRLTEPDYWEPGPRVEGADDALAAIPDGATVVSDITLMAYLAPRTTVYWIGNDNPVPEYAVLYQGSGIYDVPPDDAADWAAERFPGESFTQILDVDGFLVARHDG